MHLTSGCTFLFFSDFGRDAHILDPAVRARADDHLIELHVARFVDGARVFGKMGEGYRGFNRIKVESKVLVYSASGSALRMVYGLSECFPLHIRVYFINVEDPVFAARSMAMLAIENRSSMKVFLSLRP